MGRLVKALESSKGQVETIIVDLEELGDYWVEEFTEGLTDLSLKIDTVIDDLNEIQDEAKAFRDEEHADEEDE